MELNFLEKSEHADKEKEYKKTFVVVAPNGDGQPHEESFDVWYIAPTEEIMTIPSAGEQLARIIKRWTLTEGGEPVPITKDFFASRPVSLSRWLLDGIVADYFPQKKLK